MKWATQLASRLASAVYSPDRSTAAAEVFDYLETKDKNPGFESALEVEVWALQVADYLYANDEGMTDDLVAKDLATRLLGPLGAFQFEVVFEQPRRTRSEFVFEGVWHFPGSYNLALSWVSRNGQGTGFVLLGAVESATWDGAAHRVASLVDEFCGALRCIGLCEFVTIQADMVRMTGPHPNWEAWARLAGGQIDLQDGQRFHDLAGEIFGLDPDMAKRLQGTRLTIPTDLSEIEARAVKQGDLERGLGRHLRTLAKAFWSDGVRAGELRDACRRIVWAELTRDAGLAVTLAFSCLEGLLLDPKSKADTLSRLREAVAHGLGKTLEERADLRAQVNELYELRSGFVHTGVARMTATSASRALDLARRVVRREIDLLPDPPHAFTELVPP